MALEKLEITFPPIHATSTARQLMAEADRYWDEFVDTARNRRLPRYIPSDPSFLYSALHCIRDDGLAQGEIFCEWGSGFGVGACLAAELGFQSYGVEIESELIGRSRRLAAQYNLPVEFLHESYFPEGYDACRGVGGHDLIRPPRSRRHIPVAYSGMEIDIDEIDVFYVYPWPDEQQLMLDLFDAVAGEEALLLAYFSHGDLNLYRKVWDE